MRCKMQWQAMPIGSPPLSYMVNPPHYLPSSSSFALYGSEGTIAGKSFNKRCSIGIYSAFWTQKSNLPNQVSRFRYVQHLANKQNISFLLAFSRSRRFCMQKVVKTSASFLRMETTNCPKPDNIYFLSGIESIT
jgi:hypothetical protein